MKMKTKTGKLTRYALACGYIENRTVGAFSARLYMLSPSAGVIQVTAQGDDWRILYSGKSLVAARAAMRNYFKGIKV